MTCPNIVRSWLRDVVTVVVALTSEPWLSAPFARSHDFYTCILSDLTWEIHALLLTFKQPLTTLSQYPTALSGITIAISYIILVAFHRLSHCMHFRCSLHYTIICRTVHWYFIFFWWFLVSCKFMKDNHSIAEYLSQNYAELFESNLTHTNGRLLVQQWEAM